MAEQTSQRGVHKRVDGSTARLRLSGELDVHGASRVTDELAELAAAGPHSVIVDVADVTFLDSTGLRALIVGRDQIRESGASFQLEGVGGVVERVLTMTGLHDFLTGTDG
ncbi:STAS domain-containing protein [soil metagenome]